MMGHREKMVGGDEYDVLTQARHIYIYTGRAGECRRVKKKFNRRIRRKEKEKLRVPAEH